MADFKEIKSIQEFSEVLQESQLRKLLIFKHSTTCPVSARAWQEVQKFILESSSDVLVAMIKVIESRPTSNHVAEHLGVKHQSPQALLLHKGQVLWQASHQAVTETAIKSALKGEASPFNITCS